jgi:hypothetical protein
MVLMVVMSCQWEVMKPCSNGSNEAVLGLQNDHAVMKTTHVVNVAIMQK